MQENEQQPGPPPIDEEKPSSEGEEKEIQSPEVEKIPEEKESKTLTKKKEVKKRGESAYHKFISQQMKQGKNMEEAVEEWNAQKEGGSKTDKPKDVKVYRPERRPKPRKIKQSKKRGRSTDDKERERPTGDSEEVEESETKSVIWPIAILGAIAALGYIIFKRPKSPPTPQSKVETLKYASNPLSVKEFDLIGGTSNVK